MDLKTICAQAHQSADALFLRIEQECRERYVNDDLARLSFEVGYLHGVVRSLMIDLELSKLPESE